MYPSPSIDRDFRFRAKINHSINKAATRAAIPTVTPTIVGTFELEADSISEAGVDVTGSEEVIVGE